MMTTTKNPTIIPTVSFAPFLTGDSTARDRVARQVYTALSTVGFIYLSDHGVSARSIDRVFTQSKRFFALPLDQKLSYRLCDPAVNQGYTADGAEGINDHKESYEHRRFQNPWSPDESVLPDFNPDVAAFYRECMHLSLEVLRCFALILHLDENYFDQLTQRADPQLRLLHYPAVQRSEIERQGHSRINAHSDFGLCTLLFQDDVGGLEIDPGRNGEFVPALPVEGTVVVNVGELMQRLTNDRVEATVHRVVSPPATDGIDEMLPDRYSIAFFVHPDPETVIDPIVRDAGEVKKYEAVNAKA